MRPVVQRLQPINTLTIPPTLPPQRGRVVLHRNLLDFTKHSPPDPAAPSVLVRLGGILCNVSSALIGYITLAFP